jgi:hypothetical protein
MNARRSRIQRKAARVERTEFDREFNAELAALRRIRMDAGTAANAAYEQAVKEATAVRTKAKNDADEAYDDARAKLLKRLAKKEAQAA